MKINMNSKVEPLDKIDSKIQFKCINVKKNSLIIASVVVFIIILILIIVPIVVLTSNYVFSPGVIPNCSRRYDNYSYKSAFGIYQNAAIAVDSPFCANIGKDILLMGGSAIDAAISVSICNGISNPQSMGIGGGHMMIIFLKNQNKMIAIDSREVAPLNAHESMFVNNSEASEKGGLASAVPGEIAGYWEAHKIGGKLPWKQLFEPTIALCKNGTKVSAMLAWGINEYEKLIRLDPGLSKVFINPDNNQTLKENEIVRYFDLANTLEKIAEKGVKVFYDGELSKIIVEENNLNGGILTLADLRNYKPILRNPIKVSLNGKYRFYGIPPPSSGLLVSFILSIMSNYNYSKEMTVEDKIDFTHHIIESFKHSFAKRSQLGDPDFVDVSQIIKNLTSFNYIKEIFDLIDDDETLPESFYKPAWSFKEDHGTAHISVVASNGDAVSLTSTINTFFGAKYAGKNTGIVYNNEMDDFSTPNTVNYFGVPASTANFIEPQKRPMSSMSPIIILDENDDVRLVLGAAGGTKIITSVAAAAVKTLFLNESLADTINEPRFHHQLIPNYVSFESDFPEDLYPQSSLIKGLIAKKHKIQCFDFADSIVEGIERLKNGRLLACSDHRKGGEIAGF